MRILVINCGSSTVRYQLIDMEDEQVVIKGKCDLIGKEGSFIQYKQRDGEEKRIECEIKNYEDAIRLCLDTLGCGSEGISAVGHRVVHGGEKFKDSVVITSDVVEAVKDCANLAPLHNPPNILGIEACQKFLPDVPMTAVFDTSFHQTMSKSAYLYALPYEAYEKYSIRRYGFHGTSHKYVAQRATSMLGKPLNALKIITCHLGNGSSMCAVDRGKSVDTSMGFTPLEGLVMGTRSGDLDPAVVTYLMVKEKMGIEEMDTYLNKKSGLLGIWGNSDYKETRKAAEEGNNQAQLALDIFSYRVKKYIGAYTAALNGLDALVFTAGIGENDWYIREKILNDMDYLGIGIDHEKNMTAAGIEMDISSAGAKVHTLVIPTNEELMIARETKRLIDKR